MAPYAAAAAAVRVGVVEHVNEAACMHVRSIDEDILNKLCMCQCLLVQSCM